MIHKDQKSKQTSNVATKAVICQGSDPQRSAEQETANMVTKAHT